MAQMNSLEDVKYNKKFGIITNQQLILNSGKLHQNKIYFESIKKINLVKERVFYTNLSFLSLSILSATLLYLYFEIHLGLKIALTIFSLITLIFSAIHKFYLYRIVIKLNNNEKQVIKATQIHRRCIKEFYYVIFEAVKRKNKVAYSATTPLA